MAYYITQGTNFQYVGNGAGETAFEAILTDNQWTASLPGLLEMSELAFNGAGGSYDQIEVTCLADSEHKYVDGLVADAGSDGKEITFKFLYDPKLFNGINQLMEAERTEAINNPVDRAHNEWKITIPNGGGSFTITGDVSSIALDSVALNDKLTFTMVLAVKNMTFAPLV